MSPPDAGEPHQRLQEYFDMLGRTLGHASRRKAFAMYAVGLLSDLERKSVEPIAAMSCGDPTKCRAVTEKLLHFVGESEWDDLPLRLAAVRHGLRAMTERGEKVEVWIFDDTGFIKQGDKSPGVQRQYTGCAGKVTNCQVGVSLTLATRTAELPVDMDLYLPESWTKDRARCRAAHIPDDVAFRAKWQIALEMAQRALDSGFPPGLVLADSAYGSVGAFRDGLGALGLDYAVDVQQTTRVHILCDDGSQVSPMSVAEVADVLGARAYRKTTWRQGTKAPLASKFAAVRVRVARSAPSSQAVDEEQWLLIERPNCKVAPTHYVLATLPKNTTRKQLVRKVKQRWRIERTYEDMKGEFGLDHFEGRSFRGFNHHVSCVIACYAFVLSERVRAFPPSARRAQEDHPLDAAA